MSASSVKLQTATTHFILNEEYHPKQTAVITQDSQKGNVGLERIDGSVLQAQIHYSLWKDSSNVPYVSQAALVAALITAIFVTS